MQGVFAKAQSAPFALPQLAAIVGLVASIGLVTDPGEAAVPINFGVNQLFTVGGHAFQVGAGIRYWADLPDGGPDDFGFRINLVALFPVE